VLQAGAWFLSGLLFSIWPSLLFASPRSDRLPAGLAGGRKRRGPLPQWVASVDGDSWGNPQRGLAAAPGIWSEFCQAACTRRSAAALRSGVAQGTCDSPSSTCSSAGAGGLLGCSGTGCSLRSQYQDKDFRQLICDGKTLRRLSCSAMALMGRLVWSPRSRSTPGSWAWRSPRPPSIPVNPTSAPALKSPAEHAGT